MTEACLGIGIDASVKVRLAFGEHPEYARQGIHSRAGDRPRQDCAKRGRGIAEGSRE
ncbi:hypothetical protein PPNSA23_28220 [Phyllobacterium phragmitis]|uniref:Uncharacterized protein n=1 Tax=Phyllobacterium phragmitis TaxID=2670329 RepID=A0ABQ0H1U3_9HYPH